MIPLPIILFALFGMWAMGILEMQCDPTFYRLTPRVRLLVMVLFFFVAPFYWVWVVLAGLWNYLKTLWFNETV